MQKRNTLQRQLVLQTLRTLHTHVTAEDIYAAVSQEFRNISLATVYRNLNSLAQDGEIKKIPVPGAADRFDFTTANHYHLYCLGCSRFEDAPLDYLLELGQEAARQSGYEISCYDIVFTGYCPACAAANRQKRTVLPPISKGYGLRG